MGHLVDLLKLLIIMLTKEQTMLTTKQAREIVSKQIKYFQSWTDKSRASDGEAMRNLCFHVGYLTKESDIAKIKNSLELAGHTGKTRLMGGYLRLTNLEIN